MDSLHLNGRIINIIHTTRPYMSTDIAADSANGGTNVCRAVKEELTGKEMIPGLSLDRLLTLEYREKQQINKMWKSAEARMQHRTCCRES